MSEGERDGGVEERNGGWESGREGESEAPRVGE